MSLHARFLGILRNQCTCLSPLERSDLAADLVCAVEADQGRPSYYEPPHDLLDCGHDESNESVLGHCRACDMEHAGTGGTR